MASLMTKINAIPQQAKKEQAQTQSENKDVPRKVKKASPEKPKFVFGQIQDEPLQSLNSNIKPMPLFSEESKGEDVVMKDAPSIASGATLFANPVAPADKKPATKSKKKWMRRI